MIKKLLSSLCFLLLSVSAFSQQPGSLDPSFNGKGIKSFYFTPNVGNDEITASYVQPDGKLLVAVNSSYYDGESYPSKKVVMRLLSDGQLDKTFGKDGKVDLDETFELSNLRINAIVVRSDGRIVMAGHTSPDGTFAAALSLKADGAIDESFGSGYGYVTLSNLGSSFNAVVLHQSTGNIFLVGYTDMYQTQGILVSGMRSNGELIDAYAAKGGISEPSLSTYGVEYASAAVIKGDVLYAGATTTTFNAAQGREEKHVGIVAIDVVKAELAKSFFNQGDTVYGKLIVPLADSVGDDHLINRLTSMGFSPDKQTLFLGGYQEEDFGPAARTEAVTGADFLLVKIDLLNNTFPAAFAGNGIAVYTPGADNNFAYSMAINADGKVLLGGVVENDNYWTAIRIDPTTGLLDSSFGENGKKIYNGQNGNPVLRYYESNGTGISATHYLSSGNYMFIGVFSDSEDNTRGYVKQVTSSGIPTTSFGGATGAVVCGALDARTTLFDLAVRNDGKVAVVGYEEIFYKTFNYGVGLINADGTKDTLFGGANTSHGTLFIDQFFGDTSSVRVVAVEAVAGDKLLLAGDYMAADGNRNIFVMRLTQDGLLDTDFNKNGTPGYNVFQPSTDIDYVQGLTLQGDKILVFGTYFTPALDGHRHGIVRFTADGVLDTGFGGSATGMYLHSRNISQTDADVPGKTMDVQVYQDGKIACVGTMPSTTQSGDRNMYAFRLNAEGSLDNLTFATGGEYEWSKNFYQNVTSACITADERLIIGGSTDNNDVDNYTLVALKKNGTLDSLFGVEGAKIIPASSYSVITSLHAVDGKIVASGARYVDEDGYYYITALRFTSKGALDNTFAGQALLTPGLAAGAVIKNNKLYVAGPEKFDGDYGYGAIVKIALGTGPVISTTLLNVANQEKALGDEPFLLKPISTSPAPFTYTITQGGCATVNATTGLVTMTCADTDPGIQIKVTQAAISGYTAATAYATLRINPGNPKITFLSQGGLVGDTITLAYSSNSDGFRQFETVENNGVFEFYGENQVIILEEGTGQLRLRYFSGTNYKEGSVIANISGYENVLPPTAANDEASLVFGQASTISFNVIANDQGFTGSIDPKSIDLDPTTPEIDTIFISPSLGLFTADTNGVVTYTPFSGFIGSGSIDYTIRDSRHSVSSVATIRVSVKLQGEAPELKATEMITPNGDGLNEAFVIGFVDLEKENVLKIFDRNGQELFTKTNYNNDWRGELTNGNLVENGVYYFVFIEGNANGNQRELKGAVEVRK